MRGPTARVDGRWHDPELRKPAQPRAQATRTASRRPLDGDPIRLAKRSHAFFAKLFADLAESIRTHFGADDFERGYVGSLGGDHLHEVKAVHRGNGSSPRTQQRSPPPRPPAQRRSRLSTRMASRIARDEDRAKGHRDRPAPYRRARPVARACRVHLPKAPPHAWSGSGTGVETEPAPRVRSDRRGCGGAPRALRCSASGHRARTRGPRAHDRATSPERLDRAPACSSQSPAGRASDHRPSESGSMKRMLRIRCV